MTLTKTFTDMLGKETNLIHFPPKRIISVVPSQTELLYDLDLEKEVIGITKFCIHPEKWFRNKTRIGGTKTLNIEKIKSLEPQLVIANKEENTEEQINELAQYFPVWTSDIKTLDDALVMIKEIGKICGKEIKAQTLADKIEIQFQSLPQPKEKISVAYFIWKSPWMTIGKDTFINDMLCRAGFENVFADLLRYPEIQPEELTKRNPQIVFLSSEPYPFKEKHIEMVQRLLPNATVKLVDGEMFSWYGSRLLYTVEYLHRIND